MGGRPLVAPPFLIFKNTRSQTSKIVYNITEPTYERTAA